MRTLGEPWVSVGAAAGSPSEVRITVAWELTWYQWGVDLGDELRATFPIDRGDEVGQLDGSARQWNATRLSRRAAPPRRTRAGPGPRRRAGRLSPVSRLTVNVDGGARGNPGPAAIGAVVRDADGEVLEEVGERIGRTTNNVAEYKALLLGIERAEALGASELELVGDSELIVRQVKGEYKVKDAAMRELHAQVKRALESFDRWSIRHVRREENAEADRLVNEALDGG